MSSGNFFKNLFKAKAQDIDNGLVNLAVALDSDGAAEAAILQKQEQHKLVVQSLVEAQTELAREEREFRDIETLYNKKLAAAERAQTAGDETAALELLDAVEKLAPKLAKERTEFESAQRYMTEMQQAADEISTELKTLREKVNEVKQAQKEAELATEKAKKEQARAEQLAGLRSATNKFDVAMNALQKQVDRQQQEALVAKTIAEQLRTPAPTMSSAASKYMDEVNDTPASTETLAEKLARLKKAG